MNLILACDLGGTALKGGLLDESGKLLRLASAPCGMPVTDQQGRSEVNPEVWWRALKDLIVRLLKPGLEGDRIVGLAMAGLTRTQVFLDAQGRAVRPAITWADGRAEDQAARIRKIQEQKGYRARTFGPVNAFHTLARMLWVKENEPELFETVRMVLEPKDYLNYRLTGKSAGDQVSLARLLLISDRTPAVSLFESLGIPPEVFPRLKDPREFLGPVRTGLEPPLDRLAGVPVFVGGMDAWTGALGTGAVRQGRALNISGTSEVFGVVTPSFHEAPGLVVLPWGDGLFQMGGPSQSGADSLAWFVEAFHPGEPKAAAHNLLTRFPEQDRQVEPVLFFPYLQGERTPLWSPEARGLFLGLNRRHREVDLLWAVVEGVAYNNRQVLELALGSGGDDVAEIRISGGASHSDSWCQVKADVLARPVVRTDAQEAGLLGAAMIVLAGLDRSLPLARLQEDLVRVERVFEPRTGRVEAHDRYFPVWLEAQKALLPLSERLTRTSAQTGGDRLDRQKT